MVKLIHYTLSLLLATQSAFAMPNWFRRSTKPVLSDARPLMTPEHFTVISDMVRTPRDFSIPELIDLVAGKEEERFLSLERFSSHFGSERVQEELNLKESFNHFDDAMKTYLKNDRDNTLSKNLIKSIATLISISENPQGLKISGKARSWINRWLLQFTSDWIALYLKDVETVDQMQEQLPQIFIESINLALPSEVKNKISENIEKNQSRLLQLLKKLEGSFQSNFNKLDQQLVRNQGQKDSLSIGKISRLGERLRKLYHVLWISSGIGGGALFSIMDPALYSQGGPGPLIFFLTAGVSAAVMAPIYFVGDSKESLPESAFHRKMDNLKASGLSIQENIIRVSIYITATKILQLLLIGAEDPVLHEKETP